jgi:glutathione S-transferase
VQLLVAWRKTSWGKTEEEREEGKKESAVAVENLERALRECSKGKPFFGGDSAGYLDVMLGGLLKWVRTSEELQGVKPLDPAMAPLLAAWADSFEALQAVRPVMPEVNRLVELAKMLQAKFAAEAASAGN